MVSQQVSADEFAQVPSAKSLASMAIRNRRQSLVLGNETEFAFSLYMVPVPVFVNCCIFKYIRALAGTVGFLKSGAGQYLEAKHRQRHTDCTLYGCLFRFECVLLTVQALAYGLRIARLRTAPVLLRGFSTLVVHKMSSSEAYRAV